MITIPLIEHLVKVSVRENDPSRINEQLAIMSCKAHSRVDVQMLLIISNSYEPPDRRSFKRELVKCNSIPILELESKSLF